MKIISHFTLNAIFYLKLDLFVNLQFKVLTSSMVTKYKNLRFFVKMTSLFDQCAGYHFKI